MVETRHLAFFGCRELEEPEAASLIAHSGRGRMPIRVVNGEEYATYWVETILPVSVSVIEGPEPKYSFIRSASLKQLKAVVSELAGK